MSSIVKHEFCEQISSCSLRGNISQSFRYQALAHKTETPRVLGIMFQRRATGTLLVLQRRRFRWVYSASIAQTRWAIECAGIFFWHARTLSHAASAKDPLAVSTAECRASIELENAMCEQPWRKKGAPVCSCKGDLWPQKLYVFRVTFSPKKWSYFSALFWKWISLKICQIKFPI